MLCGLVTLNPSNILTLEQFVFLVFEMCYCYIDTVNFIVSCLVWDSDVLAVLCMLPLVTVIEPKQLCLRL